jgi:polar amino acid transport system substrate-binding protein
MVTIIKRLATFFLVLLSANSVFAQAQQEKLRVATRLVKPFVYDEAGTLTGFSVELWHELSRQLKVNSDFVVKASVKDLLQAVKSKEVHLGISAVSITAEREIDFDFSQPMFDAGLQILTPAQGTKSGLIGAIVAGIFSSSSRLISSGSLKGVMRPAC